MSKFNLYKDLYFFQETFKTRLRKRVKAGNEKMRCNFVLIYTVDDVKKEKSTIRCSQKNKRTIRRKKFVIRSKEQDPFCRFILDMRIRHGKGTILKAKRDCEGDLDEVYDCDTDCSSLSSPRICKFSLELVNLKTDGEGHQHRADGRSRSILGFKRTDPGHDSVSMPAYYT